ncbi:MAG: hypothetical protein M5U34_23000 [Chloroflexi bacterium]|nr:hypothetical protein [Chloroflexota bacterium]
MRVKPAERVNGASVNQAAPEGLADMPSTLSGVCPYFGLADDPQTRLLFASPAGCCHRVEPVAHVALDHQQTACLTSAHVMCPVFKRPEWDTLPPDLIYRDPGSRSHRFWPWLVVGLVGLALLWGVFWIGGDGGFLNRIDLEPTPAVGLAVGLPLPTKTTTPPPSKSGRSYRHYEAGHPYPYHDSLGYGGTVCHSYQFAHNHPFPDAGANLYPGPHGNGRSLLAGRRECGAVKCAYGAGDRV